MLNKRQFAKIASKTLAPGTGATVDPSTGKMLKKGWAGAVSKDYEDIVPTEEYGPKALKRYARRNVGALSQPGHHLGIWHEPGEGVYLDVSKVHPETYEGGVRSLAGAYHPERGVGAVPERSVYRMGPGHTMYTAPSDADEQSETEQAVAGLRKQQPKAKPIAEMSTKKLGRALRNRRPV